MDGWLNNQVDKAKDTVDEMPLFMGGKGMCKQCEEVKVIIQEFIDKQGHSRCWYYPEIFEKLCAKLGIESKLPTELPSQEEFERGCIQYRKEQYNELNRTDN